eukprot:TRINITY_DN121630_c0_g1_i1.p1 TRINITY_DN121630_c0_g1~~TRINITY_DN121630_c0_g1_i1.p1  ORF type:complete len:777 (+),score=153.26 TRINITY_DN121630_c0_g1_i1:106-2436(+)
MPFEEELRYDVGYAAPGVLSRGGAASAPSNVTAAACWSQKDEDTCLAAEYFDVSSEGSATSSTPAAASKPAEADAFFATPAATSGSTRSPCSGDEKQGKFESPRNIFGVMNWSLHSPRLLSPGMINRGHPWMPSPRKPGGNAVLPAWSSQLADATMFPLSSEGEVRESLWGVKQTGPQVAISRSPLRTPEPPAARASPRQQAAAGGEPMEPAFGSPVPCSPRSRTSTTPCQLRSPLPNLGVEKYDLSEINAIRQAELAEHAAQLPVEDQAVKLDDLLASSLDRLRRNSLLSDSMESSGDGRPTLDEGLLVDLCASDYSGGASWMNRVRTQPDATVPQEVRYDSQEKAFFFGLGGNVITVPIATNPVVMSEATYAIWVKLLANPEGNLGWILCQSPDYVWSRGLTISDWRLGHVSATTGLYWDSQLGKAPVGTWLHIVGVWRSSTCTVYLNGQRGGTQITKNGRGHDPDEALTIGGYAAHDSVHNPAVAISTVNVYNRALTDEEVERLYQKGFPAHAVGGASEAGPGGGRRLRQQLSDASDGFAGLAPSAASISSSTSPRSALLAKAPATCDVDSRLFWVNTGVNAYDIPDGHEWQRDFKLALQKSELAQENEESTCSQPASPTLRPKGRRLAYQASDPSKLERRIVHNKVLQKMPVKAGVPLQVQDRNLALFRFGSQVFAVDRSCPHQGGNLAEGEIGDIEDMVDGRKCYITCPVHKFQFDLSTGKVLHGKCPPLPTYAVRLRSVEDAHGVQLAIVDVGFESLASHYFDEFEADDF